VNFTGVPDVAMEELVGDVTHGLAAVAEFGCVRVACCLDWALLRIISCTSSWLVERVSQEV
jgi:hypothetical protein